MPRRAVRTERGWRGRRAPRLRADRECLRCPSTRIDQTKSYIESGFRSVGSRACPTQDYLGCMSVGLAKTLCQCLACKSWGLAVRGIHGLNWGFDTNAPSGAGFKLGQVVDAPGGGILGLIFSLSNGPITSNVNIILSSALFPISLNGFSQFFISVVTFIELPIEDTFLTSSLIPGKNAPFTCLNHGPDSR